MLATVIFWPMPAAVAAYVLGRKNERARDVFVLAAVAVTFASSLLLALFFSGMELRLGGLPLASSGALVFHFRIDGFRALFGCVTGFLWLVTTLFSPEYFSRFSHSHTNLNRYWLFNLLTLGAAMGVFFSADLRTTFIFLEVMSFTSYVLVAHDENPAALRAAETYLAIAVIGGLVQLLGMLLLLPLTGTLEFARLYEISAGMQDKSPFYLPGALLLVGFGAKAGMFPLHIWLPKAHPIAPAPASALFSGILVKTGVFGVVVVSSDIFLHDYRWGAVLLILATVTMVLGAVLAVFSNDIKRTFACSSVSQIGFILTGVAMHVLFGEHSAFGARGAVLHMLNHSLLKLVLFLAAGVVCMHRHELELNKIRGFGRGKPLFMFVFIMAALGICGVPLWSGHVSKTLLHKSLADGIIFYSGFPLEYLLQLSYWTMVFTGGLTVAYMTKLFVTLFVERGETIREEKHYISRPSAVALGASAALPAFLGSFPAIMDVLAGWSLGFFHGHVAPEQALRYFEWANVTGAVNSIAIGAIIYLFVVRGLLMRRTEAGAEIHAALWPEWLDLENLIYRPLLKFLALIAVFLARVVDAMPDILAQRPSFEKPVMIGAFSLYLLLVGIGICIALIYVLAQALLYL